jgi:hypothetical protein
MKLVNQNMIVLGMSGKLGVGKNFLSDHFVVPRLIEIFKEQDIQLLPYYFSFGSFIKSEIYARDMTNTLSFHNLFVEKTTEVREHLQRYGTEVGRQTVRSDVWIRQLESWISIQQYQLSQLPVKTRRTMVPLYIVQDIRFENELAYIKSLPNSLVIRVVAPKRNEERHVMEKCNRYHPSEIDLDGLPFEHIVHNDIGEADDVLRQLENIVKRWTSKVDLKIYDDLGK